MRWFLHYSIVYNKLMPSGELSVVFYYVYLLRSLLNRGLCVGFAHDLKKRVAEHDKGLSPATKPYKPWELVYYEAHRSEHDAKRRERYLKTAAGEKTLRRILREQFINWRGLSQQKVYY